MRNLCELVTVSGKYLRYIVSLGNTGKANTDAMIREPGDLPPVRYGMTTSNWPGYQKRREDLKNGKPFCFDVFDGSLCGDTGRAFIMP